MSVACFLAAAVPAGAEIGTIDDVPAATLLLPYFEVDLSRPDGMTTLFSINNAAAGAAIAHVTLWTDQSIPTLDFDVYLTGYDVQTINLRDVFNGNVPRTADRGADSGDTASPSPPPGPTQAANVNPFTGLFTPGVPTEFDFGGSSGPCVAAYTNPVLDNFRITNLQAAHTGKNAPAYGGCLGANHGDDIARGYVTVDSVTQCNLLFPSSATYFSSGILDDRNILWGDYFYIPQEGDAQGETLVHIESCPHPSVGNGAGMCLPFLAQTFYGRYAAVAGLDQREPLPSAFATRFINGGPFEGGTDLIVWRDSNEIPIGANGVYACGSATGPAWAPLNQVQVLAFDEQENPEELCFVGDDVSPPLGGQQTCFPLEAQRVSLLGGNVVGADPDPSADFGLLLLDLNLTSVPGGGSQAWVTTIMNASPIEGARPGVKARSRFSISFDATRGRPKPP